MGSPKAPTLYLALIFIKFLSCLKWRRARRKGWYEDFACRMRWKLSSERLILLHPEMLLLFSLAAWDGKGVGVGRTHQNNNQLSVGDQGNMDHHQGLMVSVNHILLPYQTSFPGLLATNMNGKMCISFPFSTHLIKEWRVSKVAEACASEEKFLYVRAGRDLRETVINAIIFQIRKLRLRDVKFLDKVT